jgi:NAD(P)-dependent dehydrogenase (short-subunit alcohol dehydrogenase family)
MTKTFGYESTTEEVLEGVDLSGKRYLVTGVSAGLGTETARALAAHGASVIGTARDLAKAREATHHVEGDLELVEMDLASLASIRACADRLLATGQRFDAVIANAGVMATPLTRTADGFELQFGTNHLGHFAFVNRIAPLIKTGGRLVNLSSSGHRFSNVDLEDPNFEHTAYDPWQAYGRSKTANILFAVAFDARHKDRGIRAAAVHPGGIQTELGRHIGHDEIDAMLTRINADLAAAGKDPFRWKTIPEGAATSVWTAIVANSDEIGGRYCENCHVSHVIATDAPITPVSEGVRAYALDPELAEKLWTKSEELIGERF